MQTAKYHGVLNPLEYKTHINELGSIRTDEIFEGQLISRFLVYIQPENTVSISIKQLKGDTEVILETYPTIATPSFLDLQSLYPLIIEIVGSCDVLVKTLKF